MAQIPIPIAPPPPDDRELLRRYAQGGSSEAFGEIVHRYADLVYSAARRQLGDFHHAEDVTQAVFVLLTKKASSIRGPLAGWLLLSTHYCCRNAIKMTMRRTFHEQQATKMKSEIAGTDREPIWEEISGTLDAALARLGRTDRDAIALRYLKGSSLREVAAALGVGEDAARKRVERGMQRLRGLLGAGTATPAILADQLLQHGTQSAPAHLIHVITSTGGAIAKGTFAAAVAQKAGASMALAHVKVAAIVLTAAALAVPTVPAAVHLIKSFSGAPGAVVQTPVQPPAVAPAAADGSSDAAPAPAVATLSEKQILTALKNDADLTVREVSPLSGKDLADAIAQIDVDDSQAELRSVVRQFTRVSLGAGGASIMTCGSDDTARQLHDALLSATDDNFVLASGPIVVQVTGTPAAQLAAARAISDDAGLQYLDVLQLRGRPMVLIRWSSPSTLKRLNTRLHITDGIRKVDTGYYEDNGREFHVVTINVANVDPEALAGWSAGSGIKYRTWGQTVFAVKNGAGDPYPGVYGWQRFDEFACRIARLSVLGVKIKSLQYVTDGATNELTDPVIDAVCVVDGKDVGLRFKQTVDATAPGDATDHSVQFDDGTVQSLQGALSDSLQSAIKSAMGLQQ
jgi:RNA polymerase sigma factor (sigma-70 family)